MLSTYCFINIIFSFIIFMKINPKNIIIYYDGLFSKEIMSNMISFYIYNIIFK